MFYGLYKGKKLIEVSQDKEELEWFDVEGKTMAYDYPDLKKLGYRILPVSIKPLNKSNEQINFKC